jgi:hypothetical protein
MAQHAHTGTLQMSRCLALAVTGKIANQRSQESVLEDFLCKEDMRVSSAAPSGAFPSNP